MILLCYIIAIYLILLSYEIISNKLYVKKIDIQIKNNKLLIDFIEKHKDNGYDTISFNNNKYPSEKFLKALKTQNKLLGEELCG